MIIRTQHVKKLKASPKAHLKRKFTQKKRSYREEAPKIALLRRLRLLLRRGMFVTGGGLVCALIISSLWFWYSGTSWEILNKKRETLLVYTASKGLRVEDIFLEGQHFTNSEEILAALSVKRQEPILGINLQEMKGRLEKLEWVRYAEIERELPSALHVHIIEREPVALWQHAGQIYVIDKEGTVIDEPEAEKKFAGMLLIVGEDAPLYAQTLLTMVDSQPELKSYLASAIRVGNRRWNMRLTNGIEIKLPEENPQQAWGLVATLQQESQVLQADISAIDLRLPDKVSIQPISDKKPDKRATSVVDEENG